MWRSASPLPTNSALRFESAAYYPEDILCPGSDEELSEQERAMKRRRVVQRGEEYLAGHAPFMMTAGLNGPFDNSWENPWAKKRSEGKTVNVDRVERASAAMRSNPPASSPLRRVPPRDSVDTTSQYTDIDIIMPPMISDTPKCRTFRHQLPIHPVSSPGPSRVRDLPRGKERDWLKKDVTSKYSRRYLSGQQSPTPTPAPRRQLSSPFAFRDIERQREDTSSFETAHEKPEARDDVNNHLRNTRKSRKADREDTHPPKTRKRRAGFEKEAAEESEREADLSKRSVLSSSQEKQHRKRQEPERAAKGKRKWRGERQKAAEAKNDIARKIAELIGEDDTKSKDEARSTPRRKDKRLRNIDPALLPSKANPPLLEEMHYEYQVPTKIATEEYPHAIPMNPPEPIGISSRATNSESHPPEQEVQKEEKQTEPEIAPQEKPNNKRKKSKANSGARRLTFTPNGGPKLRSSHRSSDARPNRSGSGPESPVQSVDAPELAQTLIKNDTRSNKTSAKTSRSSQKMLSNGDQSKESTTVLPEAQVQDLPPARVPLVSTSTNLLETDEQPTCVESVEEDSYVNLATQAAVNKAMQRFNDVVADMDTPSPNKARRSAVSDRLRNEELSTKKTPAVEPISTQAMLDQMSPFTITTIKKRSPMLRDRTASQISPSKPAAAHFANSQAGQTTLPTYSPNMSTSPSPTPTPSLSQAHPSTSPSKSPPRSPPKSQKGKQKAPPTPSTKRRKTALDSSPPPAPPPFLSRQKSSVQSHAHPERTPKSTLSELTSFSINPDGTLTERGLMDGQYPEGQILGAHGDGEGETYGTLPSLDFSKPFAGIASGGVRAGGVLGNGVTPTSTAPSVVVDEEGEVDGLGDGDWGTPHTNGSLNADFLTPTTINNQDGGGGGGGGGFHLQLTPEDVQKTERELELDAAVEEAGNFLADWNVDVDARMGGRGGKGGRRGRVRGGRVRWRGRGGGD